MDVHFFKPLIPGFATGVDIPLSFFSKYMEEGPHNKTVVLTSDVSERKWSVMLAGRKLTNGWQEFASAHGYRPGDILVFRYLGDQVFNVTGFGIKTQCELEYVTATDEKKTVVAFFMIKSTHVLRWPI